MVVLPEHIIDHINDFRFGDVNDWKNLSLNKIKSNN